MRGNQVVPFVGRSVELDQLRVLVDEVSSGGGRIALIEGEAGIGKSRLLQACMDSAAKVGFRTFAAAARDLERDRAFGLVVDAFGLREGASDPMQREIAALIEVETGVSDARFRIIERIVELVETTAIAGPILIAAEDVHWADPSTILALNRLASSLSHISVLLVCTSRPTPRTTDLTSLFEAFSSLGATRIALGRLEEEAVADLVAATLGAAAGPRLSVKVGGAAGNPLFVAELLTALDQEGLIDTSGGTAEVGDVTTPPSLTLTILRRLAFLSDESLETLRVASVLGSTFTLKDLATVTEKPPVALLPAIDEATKAALIGESGDDLTFRHELVRDAIYTDMLLPVRKALHAQAARALADAGAPAVRVATHAALGADVGDGQAVEWLHRAGKLAIARSPSVAVQFVERALELVPEHDGEKRNELTLFLVRAFLIASRSLEASRTARELLTKPLSSHLRIEAQRALFRALEMQGLWQEAVAEIDEALLDQSLSPIEEARLVAARADAFHAYDRDRARPEAERAIELGERANDALAVFVGMQTLAFCNAFDGYLEEAIRVLDRATEKVAAAMADDYFVVDERVSRRLYLVWSDRFDEAGPNVETTPSTELADRSFVVTQDYTSAHFDLWSGRWDEAIAEAEAGIAFAGHSGLATEKAGWRQLLCYVALHRDELGLVETHLEELPGAHWIPALLAEARGDAAGLREWLDSYRSRGVNNPMSWHMSLAIWWAPDWVRLYLDAGDRASALVMTEMLEEASRRAGTPTARGAALRSRALYEGDSEIAMQAVVAYRSGPRVFDRAEACEWAASLISRDGSRPEQAVALVEEALEVYESVGAVRDIARAEAQLRSLGVRRGRRGPRQRPKSGWGSLTQTEERVTSLVAEGLPYREIGDRLFISRRTVETHVAHVFAKLGLSSRRELAEMASLRGGRSDGSSE